MKKLLASLSLFTAASLLAQAPKPAPPTAVVAGSVTSADTGQPLRKAQVRVVSNTPQRTFTATTDADGRFAVKVPAGDYTVSATKVGYVDMVLGARRTGAATGTPVRVVDGQKIETLDVKLPRGGVISGTITDEFGDPSMGTAVRIMRYVFANGQRYATTFGQQDVTDDRGSYRISGLPPGEYIVTAVPKDVVSQAAGLQVELRARVAANIAAEKAKGNDWPVGLRRDALEALNQPVDMRGYIPVHYPGSVLASGAAPVRVGVSEDIAGIDIRLQVVHTANVTGTITWPEGKVPAGARVQLMDPQMAIPTIGSWWTGAQADGKFTFYGVAPGRYLVRNHMGVAGVDLHGAVEVQVDPNGSNDVELRLQRGQTVSGSLSLEGAPVALAKVRVLLHPIGMAADPEIGTERVAVDATGRFTLTGVTPARYRVSVENLPAGWTLGSAVFGDRDAADLLLEVESGRNLAGGVLKLTSRTAELTGAVTSANGQPVVNAVVLVFPEPRQLWVPQSRRIQAASLSADGRFVARGLPAGDYRVAIADPEPGQMFDHEFLTQLLTAAIPVTLGDGEKKVQDLRVR